MDNISLNVNFGIRPKRSYSGITGRNIGKNIALQVKKMNPAAKEGIIGETRFGDTVAKITINPNNYMIEVEPPYLRDEVLKRLGESFHKGNKLKHKHAKPRHKVNPHGDKRHSYNRRQYKKFNIEA